MRAEALRAAIGPSRGGVAVSALHTRRDASVLMGALMVCVACADQRQGTTENAPKQQTAFPVAIYSLRGEPKGQVLLGQMTISEVVKMLPPWPGYGPSKIDRSKFHAHEKLVPVRDRLRLAYNPALVGNIFVFDINDKLVFVQSSEHRDQITAADLASRYPQLKEVARESELKLATLQGDLQPCVTLEVLLPADAKPETKTTSVAYIYTCATNR